MAKLCSIMVKTLQLREAIMRFFVAAIFARGILTATFCSALTLEAGAITLTQFASPNDLPALLNLGAIGFTYDGNKFVGSVYTGGQLYSTTLSGGAGSVASFGPANVLNSGKFEHYLTSPLGTPGFPNGDIYVGDVQVTGTTVQNSIVHITNDGSAYDTFVTLPSGSGQVRGILFDSVGTFGNNMLVATNLGNIYEVTSSKVVTLLASLGEDAEGMAVLPNNAGFYPGNLIVASEISGNLRAIDPNTGMVTIINPNEPIKNAEIVSFVPFNLGVSGSSLEGFYESNFSEATTNNNTAVWFAGASQFSTMLGDLIVTEELGSPHPRILDLKWNGTDFDQIVIDSDFGPQPEDGIFLTSNILAAVPEPSTLPLMAAGLSALCLLHLKVKAFGSKPVRRICARRAPGFWSFTERNLNRGWRPSADSGA
jgi:hypothetical protein